ncbi:MAG TPA: transglycosylase domain-containing protein, partial [Candidatus Sulfotelmatobacter sp.]|nr:transglycosylase domain-containing protein [Candidatus Sulfotelmatobacter sp.]
RRRLLRFVLLGVAVFSALGMGLVGAVFAGYNNYISELPDAATLAAMEPPLDSHVYSADNKTMIATFHDPNFHHQHASLNDIAQVAKRATVDVEDRHFYEEGSWDLPRIFKAGWDNVISGSPTQGASTITEQLAKISFLPSERSIDRKIKQVILGNEIDANFTKDQILEMYLNRISYGNHAIGIESAAQLYFHKHANQLDLAEASMLAGLPQSPTVYNPLDHAPGKTVNPDALDRQREVLDAMVSVGDINSDQEDQAIAEAQRLTYHSWTEAESVVAPDFVDYVRRFLSEKYGDSFIRPGGWEITTTLDLGKQKVAEDTLKTHVDQLRAAHNVHDGSVVSIDPTNGNVLALVGAWNNADPQIGQLNMALRPVQPGSTIKLFTYSAAIASRKYTMETPILDAPISVYTGDVSGKPYAPLNYDRKWHGVCTLAKCLGNSINIPAVKVEMDVGVPYITNLEIASGLSSLEDPDNRPANNQYAATLGGLKYGISPLDLASGAGMIAGMGVHHNVTPVSKVIDASTRKVVYQHDPKAESERVVSDAVAFIINEVTSNDANRVMEFGPHGDLTLPDRRVSAKTGTSDYFMDNWTVGWTPDVVTAVWIGNPSPSCVKPQDVNTLAARLGVRPYEIPPLSPAELAQYGLSPVNDHCGHLEESTGITGAAPIWHEYMSKILAGTPQRWFTKPTGVVQRGANDDGDFYLPGTQPEATCAPASSAAASGLPACPPPVAINIPGATSPFRALPTPALPAPLPNPYNPFQFPGQQSLPAPYQYPSLPRQFQFPG